MKITATNVTANIVAGAAFLASAKHIYSVAENAGNPWPIAAVHAIGIDGLILIGINTLKDSRIAGTVAIAYGAIVSLLFNAASYGAFTDGPLPHEPGAPATATYGLSPMVLAVTMPAALVLAYVTIHASRPKDTPAVGQDKATRTEVDVRVRRESVPASRPAERPVRAMVVQPEPSRPATVMGEVVHPERPAITRAPSSRGLSEEHRAAITAEVERGETNNREIARRVFGADAGDAERKRVERFRASL